MRYCVGMNSQRMPPWAVILIAGAVGSLAIDVHVGADYVIDGKSPLLLFQWDASTLEGRAAYAGGLFSAAFGLFLDYIVSIVWAAVAFFTARRIAWLREHPLIAGTLLGTVVMIVMLFAVVPLSHAARPHFNAISLLIN